MMKHQGIIYTVLLFLLGFFVYLNIPDLFIFAESYQKVFPRFDKSQINQIEVYEDGKLRERVKKINDNWIVETKENAPADKARITKALDNAQTMEYFKVISDSKKVWENYDVDDKDIKILFYLNNSTTTGFIAGKAGPYIDTNYFRVVGDNRTLVVNKYIRSVYDSFDWRQK